MTDTPRQLRFDDGKEPEALRTIGEVASALDIKQHVLRYWEQQFPMLRPLKRSGGRRYYRPEDVELVSEINRLINKEGYTLKGARQALTSAPADERTISAPAQAGPDVSDLLPQLRAIRDRLANALA
ncbi:DNA-binding transcriptional MerR regulator [Altererythrobacter atlanticus]|uniref:MerR family regulatory protein n=1 Tax=Croceibacterium atlanticum TaxID=1267766 RepID=A0A0F7KN70_9SPHN|nr:MerR family transcriptional regulator [Croceibacterium atlanticum]AKH41978.1 MerR family regulatory protein [Croceibacterium atlanticum]MBB5733454.1 DNA-binding transcriptional MerR regulator [Croceibacterium atlanticum]